MYSTEDRATLQKVILSHLNTFALSDEELGETSLVEHEITLTDRTPITTPPRRFRMHCVQNWRKNESAC